MSDPVHTPGADARPSLPSEREIRVEHAPDGVHGFEGRFRELTPPERIVMTFEWDGMLESGMEGGMNESFGALDRLLARRV